MFTLRQIERAVILKRLARFRGNKPEAAKSLGISLKTLYNKLNEYAARTDPAAGTASAATQA